MTDRLVVDASVVAKAYLRDEDHSEISDSILLEFAAGSLELLAPQYILYEVPSTILNAVRQRRLSAERGADAIEEFLSLPLPTVGDDLTLPDMIRRAHALARSAGCRLYDALYLVVAQEFDAPLITADGRLYRGMARKVPQVVWIGDYEPRPERSP